MNELALSLRPVHKFLSKHHPVIFICFIAILLSIAVYSLYDVMKAAEVPSDSTATTTATQFDEKTIDRIKKLHNSSDTSDALTFPTSRFNPLVE